LKAKVGFVNAEHLKVYFLPCIIEDLGKAQSPSILSAVPFNFIFYILLVLSCASVGDVSCWSFVGPAWVVQSSIPC